MVVKILAGRELLVDQACHLFVVCANLLSRLERTDNHSDASSDRYP